MCFALLSRRLQWGPVAGMLQPEQPEQQWQPPRGGHPPGGAGAACGQLGRLLRASPPGSSWRALLLGKERKKKTLKKSRYHMSSEAEKTNLNLLVFFY